MYSSGETQNEKIPSDNCAKGRGLRGQKGGNLPNDN